MQSWERECSKLVRCPACSQLLEILTSRHCERVHGLSKKQFLQRYGKPDVVHLTAFGTVPTSPVRTEDYVDYQLFERRFKSSTRKFRKDRFAR